MSSSIKPIEIRISPWVSSSTQRETCANQQKIELPNISHTLPQLSPDRIDVITPTSSPLFEALVDIDLAKYSDAFDICRELFIKVEKLPLETIREKIKEVKIPVDIQIFFLSYLAAYQGSKYLQVAHELILQLNIEKLEQYQLEFLANSSHIFAPSKKLEGIVDRSPLPYIQFRIIKALAKEGHSNWVILDKLLPVFEINQSDKFSENDLFKLIEIHEECYSTAADSYSKINHYFEKLGNYPISPETIKGILSRRGKDISTAENKYLSKLKRKLPDYNKTLVSYEILRRQTNQLDTSHLETLDLVVDELTFTAINFSNTPFRFLVHATNERNFGELKSKLIRKGFFCASLISDEVSYFFQQSTRVGLVLDFDPKHIVLTSREDAYTPCSIAPGRFYNAYRRLQIYTSYVDKLFRENGLTEGKTTDDFSKICRLKSSIKKEKTEDNLAELDTLEKQYPEFCNDQNNLTKYTYNGITEFKLLALPHQLENLSDLIAAKNTFRKNTDLLYSTNVHPLLGPTELLLQTPFQDLHGDNNSGATPYNEIDIDLREVSNPFNIKAILVDYESFLSGPKRFAPILQEAKENGIPIFVKGAPTQVRKVANA